jgi:uncharacterized membrane protein YgcG
LGFNFFLLTRIASDTLTSINSIFFVLTVLMHNDFRHLICLTSPYIGVSIDSKEAVHRGIQMKKMVLIAFVASVLLGFDENIFAQGIYKWVDEKGTVHFSDNPTSSVFDRGKEPPKENGLEVLKKLEGGSGQEAASGGKTIRIGYSQGSGGGSSGGGSITIRSGRT